MQPKLLGCIVLVSVFAYPLKEDEPNYIDMANTHNQFLIFEQKVSISPTKKKKLIASRQALQKRIVEYFRVKTKAPIPKFYIQGSYKMGTMVMDKFGTYDVDLGVYFLTKPQIEPHTLQKYVYTAVTDHTSIGAEHRDKCIRVIYTGDFDIDLPVYYKTPRDKHPFLATKKGWMESDPKELCDWFEKKKDKAGQMQRLVKYFKAWANNRARKMPSGIALTIWVANNFKSNKRDDIAFYETAKAIRDSYTWSIESKNPATPGDDFLAKLTSVQKNNFKVLFSNLIQGTELALKQTDKVKATEIWRHYLGDKFPNAVVK